MQQRLRASLAALLSASFLAFPASASPANPLGTIISAQRAHVGSTPASLGATIYGGDQLSTESAGTLQVRVGAARFYLAGSSAADVAAPDGTGSASFTLRAGTAVFSTSTARGFDLVVKDAHIRPRADGPVVAQVSIAGPKELIVTSRRGALAFTVGEETEIIPEATAVRVLLDPPPDPADPQGPRGAGTKDTQRPPRRAARNRFIFVVIGVIAVLTYIAVDEALESPSAP